MFLRELEEFMALRAATMQAGTMRFAG
jgi:hypothetical protein